MRRSAGIVLSGLALGALLIPVGPARGQGAGLPEGAARERVLGTCTACHQASQITQSSGYTRAQWQALIGTMIDLSPSPADRDAITEYLAAHFPPSQRRAPRLVPGGIVPRGVV